MSIARMQQLRSGRGSSFILQHAPKSQGKPGVQRGVAWQGAWRGEGRGLVKGVAPEEAVTLPFQEFQEPAGLRFHPETCWQ